MTTFIKTNTSISMSPSNRLICDSIVQKLEEIAGSIDEVMEYSDPKDICRKRLALNNLNFVIMHCEFELSNKTS